MASGLIALMISGATAQISYGGTPYSFSHSLRADVQIITMPEVDVDILLAEDALADKNAPFRVGYEILTDISVDNAGTWQVTEDGGILWRLEISSPGAMSLSLSFSDFYIPEGGQLFVYNSDLSTVLGAYTHQNNREYRKFAIHPLAGDRIVLEYYDPSGNENDVALTVGSVIHGYKSIPGVNEPDTERSGWCQNNVACPEGDPWANEIRSVARTYTQGWLCSGALLNNTSQDGAQYFLTAYHCVENLNTNYTVFLWNYQASTCDGSWASQSQSVTGGILRAASYDIYSSPDFALLEITPAIPESYNVYYAGWTRSTAFPDQPVGIHHPDGDIKKISFDYDAAYGYNNNKWNVSWDDGTTEPGSSGSPLFDSDHRVVGDLSTGCSECANQYCPDQYGKFSRAWNYGNSASQRLSDWLDPGSTGVEFIDGYDPNVTIPDPYEPGDVNSDELVNIQDVIMVIGIILGSVDPDDTMMLAADVNEDGIVNVLDVISIVNMILTGGANRAEMLRSATLNLDGSTASISTEGSLAGLQLNVSGDFDINENKLPQGWEIYNSDRTILIVNLSGEGLTDAQLFTYSGELTVQNAIAGDWLGLGTTVNVNHTAPEDFRLYSAYPNPFNPVTTIGFDVPAESNVTLEIYNISGQRVDELHAGSMTAGFHTVTWNAAGHPSGLYFARLQAGNTVLNQKLVLMK